MKISIKKMEDRKHQTIPDHVKPRSSHSEGGLKLKLNAVISQNRQNDRIKVKEREQDNMEVETSDESSAEADLFNRYL